MLTIWNINFSCGHLRTINPSPYWVTAGRGSPTSHAPLKVGAWCTQTRLTASPPHRYDDIYLHVGIDYMSSIFSLINKCQKFAGYLAAIRDRWGPRYGPKRNLQARQGSMDGRASTHFLLHSGVTLACPCRSNSSKHERPCLDVLIASHTLLYGAHISEWKDEEELTHRDN
jgi:hypothetical protein